MYTLVLALAQQARKVQERRRIIDFIRKMSSVSAGRHTTSAAERAEAASMRTGGGGGGEKTGGTPKKVVIDEDAVQKYVLVESRQGPNPPVYFVRGSRLAK